MNTLNPVFIALDFPEASVAWRFLDQFPKNQQLAVKVGMELFYREGPAFVTALKERGYTVFLDLKLYDIPHTVGQATKNIARLGVDYLTLHAAGGIRMMTAAKEATLTQTKGPKLLAITQLTSFTEDELQATQQLAVLLNDSVIHLAQLAQKSGLAGVISSAYESQAIHGATSESFLSITPGIRLLGDEQGDQSRVMTPAQAQQRGANGIVVGRSITQALDPVATYEQVVTEFHKR
jgi:orotidine-5'-phosphate decarboxylase